AVTAVRIVLGLLFFVLGLNGFLHFIPGSDAVYPGPKGAFMAALETGNVLTLVKAVETLAGLLLLVGRFVPLALVMLVPIVTGIVVFHLTYAPAAGAPGYIAALLLAFLLWAYRAPLLPLLRPRAAPLGRSV
ncbi:MAG TPA: hypothetical protein VF594_03700, partial [Rubricoccaceae bacterium]